MDVSSKFVPWDELNGKVVMVTGASSGIGRDFCIDLAKAGCRIVAAARRMDRLESLCDEINTLEGSSTTEKYSKDGVRAKDDVRAVAVELDLSSKGPVIEGSVKRAWDAFGRIDVLINNAGIRGDVRSTLDLSEEEWNNTMTTNLTGTWLMSKHVCTYMHDASIRGSIINISSIAGLNRGELHGSVAYSSSKAGVITLTKVMAMEMGAFNIRVNAICPGLFRSEITEGLLQKDWLNRVVEKTFPLKTFGTTDPALTTLVRYLIHDSSNYINGNVFIVDAGVTLPGVPIFSSL
ncbi:hypothetical protein R6Q59_017708 [Mikania micrantha]|uniref:3-oxoacyl-[acyl-carrier-protein] reductase n=1 Tax=Mikania micrantha TaxID=192012 RepID=A0A5N6M382_9ASTR|nr:hypothetical protein E3N88_36207 [Mikania micrantha]